MNRVHLEPLSMHVIKANQQKSDECSEWPDSEICFDMALKTK